MSEYAKTLPPEVVYRQFIKHVWEHPLLDAFTKQHRLKGKEGTERFFNQHDIDPSHYFAIPCGSILWIAQPGSDHDMHLVTDNESTKAQVVQACKQFTPDIPLQILRLSSTSELFYPDCGIALDLLLTPDNYIAGNITFARRTRVMVVNTLAQSSHFFNWYFDGATWFETCYKFWMLQQKPNRGHWVRRHLGFQEETRYDRYKKRLAEVAKTRRPGWQRQFEQAVLKMKLPDFDIVKAAVIALEGELHISDQYELGKRE